MSWRRSIILVIVAVLIAGIGTLLFSTAGLRLLVTGFLPADTRIESVSGRLLGPGAISGLEWSSQKLGVRVGNIAWGELPYSYSDSGIRIDNVMLAGVELAMLDEEMSLGQTVRFESIRSDVWISPNSVSVENLVLSDDLIVASGDFKMTQRKDVEISAHLQWSIDTGDGVELKGRSEANGNLDILAISTQVDAPIDASIIGNLYDPTGDKVSYELALTVPPLPAGQGMEQLNGFSANMQFRGTVTELAGDGQIFLPVVIDTPAQLQIEATSAGQQFELDWTIALPDSIGADGNTVIDLRETHPSLRARLQTLSMPATLLHPDLSGEFSADLQMEGRMHPEPSFDISLIALDGTLNGQPLSGSGRLSGTPAEMRVADLELAVGVNRLSAGGLLGEISDIAWRIDAPRLRDLLPGGTGTVRGNGSVTGELIEPAGQVELDVAGFSWRDLEIDKGRLNARFDIAADTIEIFSLELGAIRWRDWAVDQADAEIRGTPSDHEIELSAESGPLRGELELSGSLSSNSWSGRIDDIRVTEPVLGDWQLETPARLSIGAKQQDLEVSCLNSNDSRVCFEASSAGTEAFDVKADATDLPIAAFSKWAPAGFEYGGYLSGNIDARIQDDKPPLGELRIAFDRLAVSDPLIDEPLLKTGNGTMLITSDQASIRADFDITLREDDRIEGQLHTGHAADAPLTGYLTGRIADLEFVPVLFPQVAWFEGSLIADTQFEGTRSNPRMLGTLEIRNGAARLLDLGITLRDIGLNAKADQAAINLNGTASSGDGSVSLAAELRWGDPLTGELRITGDQFRIADLPPTFIDVSPDLTAALSGRSVTVRGDVLVDRANLAPVDISLSVAPSADQVLVGLPEEESDEPFDLDTDIMVRLSDNIAIDAFGLTGTLIGSLRLQQAPQQPALARGTLSVKDGYFSAYGAKLDIERGRLIFSGGSIDNPNMDVRAERYAESVMAGVEVRGTLQEPRITLVSDPPMTRQNMMAVLVSGQPPRNLGSTAEQVGMSGIGTSSQGPLLGVDIGGFSISVSSSSLNDVISPENYTGYLQQFTLRYRLSKKWSIEAERSVDDTGLDIIRIFR